MSSVFSQSSILHTILALTTLTLTLSLGWKFYHNFCLLRYLAQCPAHGKWPVLRRKWTRPIPCDTDKADYSPQVRKHSCVPQLYHHLSGTSQGFSILSHTMGRIIHMRLLCGLKNLCVAVLEKGDRFFLVESKSVTVRNHFQRRTFWLQRSAKLSRHQSEGPGTICCVPRVTLMPASPVRKCKLFGHLG